MPLPLAIRYQTRAMSEPIRTVIAGLGTALGPDVMARCRALFDAEQQALARQAAPLACDLAYGPDPRQRLDLYGPAPAGSGLRPVAVFVHGGGFVQGDKAADGWPNAAFGRWAALQGFLGAVINYRLAPDAPWPAGAEDLLAAADWLAAHGAAHGGDPARIVLVGTSAGAVHIAGAVALRPDLAVRGAALLSGLYGYTALDPRDERYYGAPALYPARMPRAALAATALPLFLACAQYDPPRFQAEFLGLMAERLERHGALPRGMIAADHNHYSMALHIGTSDTRLAGELATFIKDQTA